MVSAVRKEGRNHCYDVRWSDGTSDTVAGRSLALEIPELAQSSATTLSHDDQPTPIHDPVCTTFTELLRDSNTALLAELDSSSDSSSDDDEEEDSSETFIDECCDDGDVICHGHRWITCV
ncbi:unnamed protein product [Phytophthora fragariaefolia]|uniref:Unnamed protein product n=1 Tax=Phytophthora fragariaefolia TaxID=1490495 RepID=A0A9W6TYV4_9STRA|nr:unnamed protein product [Phytophthora fragariaefolia]